MQLRNGGLIAPDAPEFVDVLQRFERSAMLLDARFCLPLTRVHFGWDPIVGLVPVFGDLLMSAVSLRLVYDARRLGVGFHCLGRMAGNVLIDLVLGAIPFIGPVFDAFYRANLRNLQLLLQELERLRLSDGAPAVGGALDG